MIQIRNLAYSYPGAPGPAIHDMDFQVGAGEIFGFLGPSGAGKSTTQKVLIGLLTGYRGEARIDGEIANLGADYYESIGVGFELPNLYLKLSALENLTFFRSLYSGPTEEPMALLEAVGLEEDAGRRVQEFSKGMKMRLNFCRSLLNKPKLIFLDEPTAGLDPANARNLRDLIRARREQGATIFLTTHNMHDADELCDRVAFIVDGQLRTIDSPRELKLRHGEKRVRVENRTNGTVERHEFSLEGIGANSDFLTLLGSGTVETIHTEEASLEDVFLSVTGRSLA